MVAKSIRELLNEARALAKQPNQQLNAATLFLSAWQQLPPATASEKDKSDSANTASARWSLRAEIYSGFRGLFDETKQHGLWAAQQVENPEKSRLIALTPVLRTGASSESAETLIEFKEMNQYMTTLKSACDKDDIISLMVRGWLQESASARLLLPEVSDDLETKLLAFAAMNPSAATQQQEPEDEESKHLRIREQLDAVSRHYALLANADFSKVVTLLSVEKTGAKSPLLVFAHYSLARILVSHEENYEQAIEHCTKAIELDPDFMLVYFNRASASQLLLGNVEQAMRDYTFLIETTGDPDAFCGRALLYKDKLLKPDLAMRDVNQCLKLDPRNSDAYATRAALYEERWQDFEKAYQDYSLAIECNPNNARALFGRALLNMVFKKDTDKALADFDRSVRLNPTAEAYNNRGVLHEQYFHNIGQAFVDYSHAIRCDLKNADAYFNRGGLFHVYFHSPDDALADYETSLTLNPHNPHCLNNRGTLLEDYFNDFEGAQHDFEKALEINPNDAKTKANLERIKKKIAAAKSS